MFPCPVFFFFNDTATTEIYTLSLHDALPIWIELADVHENAHLRDRLKLCRAGSPHVSRSEEHTSELQSRQYLVCRLLLEKEKTLLTPAKPLSLHTPMAPPTARSPPPHTPSDA